MSTNVYFQRQIVIFGCLYTGYIMYMYSRKSFSFSAAVIAEDEHLGKSGLGLITSSQALAYTIGKFVSGILVDSYSPKALFSLGLLLSGISTVVFAGCHSLWIFTLLWFLNGLSAGPGWPACAKLLKTWYSADKLGTLWSALSTSMNVAGSVGPLLAITLTGRYGWRMGMCLPGAVAMLFSMISIMFICDQPSDVGLPDLVKQDQKKKTDGLESDKKMTLLEVLNPLFFKICVGYLMTTCIRSGVLDWGQLYLIQDLNHSNVVGSGFTSSQEIGGIVGSVIAGYTSDKLLAKYKHQPEFGRMLVILVNSIIVTIGLFCLVTMVTSNSSQLLISSIGFSLGFGLYGSIALYGVLGVESAPLHLSGKAYSIVAASSNVGMILAGLPLSWIANHYAWRGAFWVLLVGALLPLVLSLSCVIYPRQPKIQKIE